MEFCAGPVRFSCALRRLGKIDTATSGYAGSAGTALNIVNTTATPVVTATPDGGRCIPGFARRYDSGEPHQRNDS